MIVLALALAPALADELRWTGLCDASALAAAGDGVLVANDEDDTLYRFDAAGQPAGSVALGPALGLPGAELDLEGAATVGERSWWIGSLGRSKRGEPRPERQLLVAVGADLTVAGSVALLPSLLSAPGFGPSLAAAEPLPPKRGGVNVEGLAADEQGRLWLGLRSPLDAQRRALVVRLDNPEAALAGAAPIFGASAWLALGGRGVRAMDTQGDSLLLVAGPVDGGDGGFGLYRWGGPEGTLSALDAAVGALRPEGLLIRPEGLLMVSDDGAVDRDGQDCKDRWRADPADPQVYFRALVLPLP